MLLSGLVFKYKCAGCNAAHCGKTKLYFKVRICEHLGIFTKESNDFKLKIIEILLIARDKRCFNKADSSLLLELF